MCSRWSDTQTRIISAIFTCLTSINLLWDDENELFPKHLKYWQIYALDSIASQTFESIVSRARERIYKPEEFHYPDGIKHEQGRAERTLDLLEKESPNYIDTFNKLHVTIGLCGLVLDNVFPNEEWKNNRRNLANIYESFMKRDSFSDTIIKKD